MIKFNEKKLEITVTETFSYEGTILEWLRRSFSDYLEQNDMVTHSYDGTPIPYRDPMKHLILTREEKLELMGEIKEAMDKEQWADVDYNCSPNYEHAIKKAINEWIEVECYGLFEKIRIKKKGAKK